MRKKKIKDIYNVVDDIDITMYSYPMDPPGFITLIIKTKDGKYHIEAGCRDSFYVIQRILLFMEMEIE